MGQLKTEVFQPFAWCSTANLNAILACISAGALTGILGS